jgi:hypothetical protein
MRFCPRYCLSEFNRSSAGIQGPRFVVRAVLDQYDYFREIVDGRCLPDYLRHTSEKTLIRRYSCALMRIRVRKRAARGGIRSRAAIDRSGRPILAHANGPDNKLLDCALSQKYDSEDLPSFSPKNNSAISLRRLFMITRTLTAIITAVVPICALDLGRAVLIPITLANHAGDPVEFSPRTAGRSVTPAEVRQAAFGAGCSAAGTNRDRRNGHPDRNTNRPAGE